MKFVAKVRGLAAVLLVFATGVATGAVGWHLVQIHHGGVSAGTPRAEGSSTLQDFQLHLDELSRELQLTGDQQQEVKRILETASERGAALHEEVVPDLLDYFETTKSELAAVLDDEQRLELERLHQEHQRAFHRFLLGHTRHSHSRH